MRTKKISDSEVLEKAFNIISKEGFETFTLDQVSKAVGLSPATLIKRFKTKKNLALLARNHKWDKNLSIGSNKVNYTEQGIDGIFKLVDLITKSVDSKRLGEHARWLGTEALNPKTKRKVSDYFELTREILKCHIVQAQDFGHINQDESADELSINLEAFIQGAIFQYIFLYHQKHISQHLPERVHFFLKPYTV